MVGRVVVVGAVNVDLVVTADRLPGPGETVVGPGVVQHGGGKGANAAVAAARMGAAVTLVGAVGDDDPGRGALDELRAEGVGVDGVAVLDGVPTGMALIVVDATGENQIAVGAGANARVDRDQVRAVGLAARTGASVVVTLGGEGALLVGAGGHVEHLPPHPATVRDTTGAGDTFNGVLAAYLAADADLAEAARAANAAAALSVGRAGARAGMPTAAAVAEALTG